MPETKETIKMSVSSMQRSITAVPHPLMDKLTESHIDKILDINARSNELGRKDAKESRIFTLLYAAAGVALFVFLTLFMVGSHTATYMELIKLILPFFAGLIGGMGIQSYLDKRK